MEVLGDTKVRGRRIKKKNSEAVVCGLERKTAFYKCSKNPKASNTIRSLSLLLERIKISASYYIKLYFQNRITGSPETMDVVLGFIRETSSVQIKLDTVHLAYLDRSLELLTVTPNSCKLNNSM